MTNAFPAWMGGLVMMTSNSSSPGSSRASPAMTSTCNAPFEAAFDAARPAARSFTSAITTRASGLRAPTTVPMGPQPAPRSRTSPAIGKGSVFSNRRVPRSRYRRENTPTSVRKLNSRSHSATHTVCSDDSPVGRSEK